ncbi:hypothetical protein N7495_009558 [Penicillium taxi]|uniref:uncharacterized protein n=1 Tax=Penicillium taxi TaxID=168475 RepID=UPI002545A03C|nr:uncharacterized protein N7495_009558 [Penicillium taxi]KAJ5885048.1 hypothetical protein N7495_009558 [Penicillium taxi]
MAASTTSRAPPDATSPVGRSSLGFLRRSKSTEPVGERKPSLSRRKMNKTQAMEEELRRQRESYAPKIAPRLPDLPSAPQLDTFGGENNAKPVVLRPQDSLSPVAASGPVDPYARNESMTHRGRYSYASSAISTVNSPRRVRRRKDPTPYNVLVIGARNSGKTTFLNFLRKSLTMPPHKHPTRTPEELEELERQTSVYEGFTSQYLETEIDGERVGLTLWDSTGLERSIVDIQLRAVTGFLESKFEETLAEEMKVVRSPGARDTHIHCTFLLLDPVDLDQNISAAERFANGTPKDTDTPVLGVLDQNLDLQVLRTILGKTTVVPVISKADTITSVHMAYLRKAVWNSLKKANIDPLDILTLEDPEEYTSSESADDDEEEEEEEKEKVEAVIELPQTESSESNDPATGDESEKPTPTSPQSKSSRKSTLSVSEGPGNPNVPFSILSPDPHSLASGEEPVGRRFPWGFADPYDAEHCDFVRLKDAVFTEWRSELREASRVIWYERWRTNRLNRNGEPVPAKQASGFGGRMGPSRLR